MWHGKVSLQVLDLTGAQKGGATPSKAHWATVTLFYRGAEGDVVPVQASYANGGRYLLQSPFQDAVSFQWKGFYCPTRAASRR